MRLESPGLCAALSADAVCVSVQARFFTALPCYALIFIHMNEIMPMKYKYNFQHESECKADSKNIPKLLQRC